MLGICLSFEFTLLPRDPASDRQYIEIYFDHFDLLLLQYMCSFVYNNISVLFGSWSKLVGFFEFKTFDKSSACFFISTLSLQLSLVRAPNENFIIISSNYPWVRRAAYTSDVQLRFSLLLQKILPYNEPQIVQYDDKCQ